MNAKSILWWGRFDPDYSRNRILRQALQELGWTLLDFRPWLSRLGDLEARLRVQVRPHLVWVPCFRQRDVLAAARWAQRQRIPLLFDPLISAYDKQVLERGKLIPGSTAAQRLLTWERRCFAQADILLADTQLHADYFRETLQAPATHIQVVPVGAEENLFHPQPLTSATHDIVEVLFYGSFIPLQGPQVIIDAARLTQDRPDIRWHLVGAGPLRKDCEARAAGLANVVFEDWIPYPRLAARIHQADILLGIFGSTPKAARVIPNKVYQALACAKPVITQRSAAYPAALSDAQNTGLIWVDANAPEQLAAAVCSLSDNTDARREQAAAAHRSYQDEFSQAHIRARLADILRGVQT